jgi:Flp pilus assembly CpaE family ATPase
MTVVVSQSDSGLERLRFMIGGDLLAVRTIAELHHHLAESGHEDLVIIGAEFPTSAALGVAEQYRASRPSLSVILVRRRVDIATLTEAMRAGVREVVQEDDPESLVAACRRAESLRQRVSARSDGLPAVGRGKIILVFSAKGGCGKTTVSTNIAEALAKTAGTKVCLVDYDLEFGDVGVALRVDPQRTIVDGLSMADSLDPEGVKSLTLKYHPQLDVLLAPTSPAAAESISADFAGAVLENLRASYDYVVVDSPPAFTDVILRAFDMADTFILLTTLDMPALKNLKVTLDTLDALSYPRDKWFVVINRSDSKVGLTLDDVERSIGVPVAGLIPSSSSVSASVNNGVTLVHSNPSHPVSEAISGLARKIRGAEAEEGKKRQRFSLRK